jgi:hypothetical protein
LLPVPAGTNPTEWADEKFKEAMHRQIADDGLQGYLIKETNTTGDERTVFGTITYDFQGYFNTIEGSSVNYKFQPYLHCEFEGGGMIELLHSAEAALAVATAAAIACSIPVIGWFACLVLSAIALLISLVGILADGMIRPSQVSMIR